MAVDIGSLVGEVKEKIELDALSGTTVAVDAFNTIYQFLSIIRGPDGMPLADSKGRVTSHLSGLLYRTVSLMESKIQPVFVFDGIPPVMKRRTLEARMHRRDEAQKAWKEAVEKGMMEEARVHAMASTRINKEIIESAKEVLTLMGVPWIQAPSEGEAQGARMTQNGLVYASASQDYDSFLFGAEVVVRNLALSGRRKLPGRNFYVNVSIERTKTQELLDKFAIDRRMLIMLGALVGTDFNEGVDKVGPKTALKIVKEYKTPEKVAAYVKKKYSVDMSEELGQVVELFEKPETIDMKHADFEALLKRAKPDKEKLMRFMVGEHEFSEERVGRVADKLVELGKEPNQKGINKWL